MVVPHSYPAALLLMLVSMLCWGSWANTQKIDRRMRFELFYWDYVWGILACAVVAGLTAGRAQPASPDSFFRNLSEAGGTKVLEAFLGGVVFNAGNLLLVAAIAVAGMAVAFPVGAGLALIIGTTLNYFITPRGNPLLLFGGIALVCAAITFDAWAYRGLGRGAKAATKGIVLSVACGVIIGLFYPLVASALQGAHHLGPYTTGFVFALGVLASNVPLNYAAMRHPVSGPPLSMREYARSRFGAHAWGVLGGVIWGVGTTSNFVASSVPLVGPATSFALGQGNTLVSALWGVFVWKEFRGAGPAVVRRLALMFVLFVLGLTCIALAPVM